MVVTCEQMKEAEEALFATGVSAESLLDLAGFRCALAITQQYPDPGRAILFVGKGNNGGDAWVIGRWLREWRWSVEARVAFPHEELSELSQKKRQAFEDCPESVAAVEGSGPLLLIDGLLGIGAKGGLRGAVAESAAEMNALREEQRAETVAIDLPSGLDGDTGECYFGGVVADLTLSISVPKRGLLNLDSIDVVGRIVEIPLTIPIASPDWDHRLLFPGNLRRRLPRRAFSMHKGQAGRVAIVAGSRGMLGAAELCAVGASRGGAGLVTLLVRSGLVDLVSARLPAEIMVHEYENGSPFEDVRADAWVVGPGLGQGVSRDLVEWMKRCPAPMILDADGLNALARERESLSFKGPRLLTPHPGEWRRLIGSQSDLGEPETNTDLNSKDPLVSATAAARLWGATILLKGSRTVIASPNQPTELNTTGHPGMASGGMGDTLAGFSAALCASGVPPHDAGCIGSWMLGRAAEKAAINSSRESITAPQVAENLGAAWRELECDQRLEHATPPESVRAS